MSAPADSLDAELDGFLRGIADRTGLDVDGSHRARMVQTVG